MVARKTNCFKLVPEALRAEGLVCASIMALYREGWDCGTEYEECQVRDDHVAGSCMRKRAVQCRKG